MGGKRLDIPMQDVLVDYANGTGLGINALGWKYGFSPQTIANRLVKAGVYVQFRKNQPLLLDVDQIAADCRDGVALQAVAEKHGVDASTIKRHMRRAGIKRDFSRKPNGQATNGIAVRLSGDAEQRLRNEAVAAGKSLSAYMAEIVTAHLSRRAA